ncbi:MULTISPECIES: T9SS type A sorting domain-containing protein [unclassified Lentimicrobium]|uniref:T9SS type A sorting domain-containing protein n=1 Tax=unclassified Lentimicrobium TaxID=2677434 RepID=UPI001553C7D9|nr:MULTISPECIES: T9SS type A sorting domain-containing protein [unclassified Lentimicrobium]NPD44121.1 T9SS type A sorting domain-containing protein [Lentimicrobium sp. S6]NPD86708.1 T9SS type A sorting domain-containing protein [Lentimicrobium sp. L6]
MKRNLLFFVLLLQASFLLGQGSLQLFDHDNNEFVNGQNHVILVDPVDWETVSPELFAKNISANDIEIKIRLEEVSVPEGSTNYFCGLGSCFAPGTMETPNSWPIAAGEMIGNAGVFSAHYQANGVYGNAVLRYTFFNIDNLNDTISVTFTYDGTTTSIGEVNSDLAVDVYPNPAQDIVYVDVAQLNLEQGSVEVYNALGELSFVQELKGESSLKLNLGSLPRGVYLYRIVSQGNYGRTSKLILK